MKNLLLALVMVLIASSALAAERRDIKDVDSDSFTTDTQVTPLGAGDTHVALIWWIPNEFWESILARDQTMAPADKQGMLNAMSGVSLLAVVQADTTQFGAFQFYPKDEVEKKMTISFTDAEGKTHEIAPLQEIKPDLEVVLGVFKPILGAAMGNLGKNMHFYVLDDSSEEAPRMLDPYEAGTINIELVKRTDEKMPATIELPLNSLFIPRKCPNGKDAHVTWKFCPWTGKKLDD